MSSSNPVGRPGPKIHTLDILKNFFISFNSGFTVINSGGKFSLLVLVTQKTLPAPALKAEIPDNIPAPSIPFIPPNIRTLPLVPL